MVGMWYRTIKSSGTFFQTSPYLEIGCEAGFTNSQSHPADILVPNWDLGKPAAFDLSVIRYIQVSMMAGSAALAS